MLTSAYKKEHVFLRTPPSGYFLQNPFLILSIAKFLKTPSEEHLQMAASENMFMKLRKLKFIYKEF